MQYSWAKLYSRLYTKAVFLAGVAVALGAFVPKAHAIITLTPANGGTVVFASNGGSTYFYFVQYSGSPALTPPAFIDFTPLDISQTQSGDTSLANMVQVTLTTNQAITLKGTEQAVITFMANTTVSTPHPAPIAAVNGVACASGNSNCMAFNQIPNLNSNHYYAAKYPGSNTSITIGFYPSDICADALQQGVQVQGCSSTSPSFLTRPTTGTPTTLQLSFSFSIAPDGNATTVPAASAVDTTATPTGFTFQVDTPTLFCPAQASLNTSYFPGDGQILLNSAVFGLNTATGAAPPGVLYVVGNKGADPYIADSTFTSSSKNALVSKAALGMINAPVTGFTNTTAATTHSYNVSFIMQDKAGIYVPPATVSACSISGVQTSAIQGFLDPAGAGKCFIATAAYGSAESAPVRMLREFRDQILLKFSAGRSFVDWYYSWSPDVADWLENHSIFRFPILLLLSPLEVVAWLCLHPFWFLLLIGVSAVPSIYLLSLLFKKDEGQLDEV